MAMIHMIDGTTQVTHNPERNLTMHNLCNANDHTWTIQTKTDWLLPSLDLVPGRRCSCGTMVIVPRPDDHHRGDLIDIAIIDSPQAALMINKYPALKTW